MGKFDLSVAMAGNAAIDFGGSSRDIETVTNDVLHYKKQAGTAIIQIGRCLEEAKGLLSHGEWLPWLQERVEFSERTATRFMRLAREWTNQTTLSDLGASKALSLLALEPSEREAFLAETHEVSGTEKSVVDMSARELERAIQERKEALEAKERAEADMKTAEAARAKMAAESKLALDRIDGLTAERDKQSAILAQLRTELAELQACPIDITGTNVPDENVLAEARRVGAEDAAKEAEERLKTGLDQAAKAKVDAEAKLASALETVTALQAKAEGLERQVKVSGSRELATMSVCFESVQETFNKMLDCLQKLALAGNIEEHNKMVEALQSLIGVMSTRVTNKLGVGGDD